MTYQVSILRNKTGQQTTLDLVPTFSSGQVVTPKQAYVFGGPVRLNLGNRGEAVLATADSSVLSYLDGAVSAGRIEVQGLTKDPWPASASDQVPIPSSLLTDPIDDAAFTQSFNSVARASPVTYSFHSLRDLMLSQSTASIDLTGKAALVWYGSISLVGNSPLVLVTTGSLTPAALGASSTTTDITTVQTTRGSTTAPLPMPDFNMQIGPFSTAKPFRLAAS